MTFQAPHDFHHIPYFIRILHQPPSAAAAIFGSPDYPSIRGSAFFHQTMFGVLVTAEISGLPTTEEPCPNNIFAFHIHSGSACTGTQEDPFADALTHYNPNACDHPRHAGDLPPLFAADSYAFQMFLTNRFSVPEIIGKTVLIHRHPDDFTTQPAGNAGEKIACGEIKRFRPF